MQPTEIASRNALDRRRQRRPALICCASFRAIFIVFVYPVNKWEVGNGKWQWMKRRNRLLSYIRHIDITINMPILQIHRFIDQTP